MIRRFVLVAALGAVVAAVAPAAVAGGWAITTIDEAPASFEAGTSYEIEYTILQHGKTPADVEATALLFRSGETTVEAPGEPTDVVGTYVARVTLPEPGAWTWEVSQGWFGVQELGTIEATQSSHGAAASTPGTWLRIVLPMFALAAMAALAVQLMRRSPLSQRAG